MKHFTGRVAVVTGGASGIGYALVRAFRALGMRVVAVDFNPEHLAARQLSHSGEQDLLFLQADVGERDQLRAVAATTLARFGKVHILCNNAGIGGGGDTQDPDFDAWDRALKVNLGGVVNGVKIFTPLIVGHGEGGHIVNTSSMAGIVPQPLPGLGAYQTAKFAVRGLSISLRNSLAPHGIGVSCLCPGGTQTRIVETSVKDDPARLAAVRDITASWMDPAEVAQAVIAGIRANAPYILTHEEFRDEVRQLWADLDAAFPTGQHIPAGRAAFEAQRRTTLASLRQMPARD